MRMSDWRSDVCSSDLYHLGGRRVWSGERQPWIHAASVLVGCSGGHADVAGAYRCPHPLAARRPDAAHAVAGAGRGLDRLGCCPRARCGGRGNGWLWLFIDRKSVVSGKGVSVRVDLGGRRIIKKKNEIITKLKRLT